MAESTLNIKICPRCSIEKTVEEFSKDKSTKDGLQSNCKECKFLSKKEWSIKNKNKISEYNKVYSSKSDKPKLWRNNNKERIKLNNENWENNNKDKRKQYLKKWQKNNKKYFSNYSNNKYNSDLNFKIKSLVSTQIYQYLKKSKTDKPIKYLGCSILEYKHYIEKQFLPEMNWENHGEIWEIDHIKALSTFDLSILDNQYIAFNYINTQPLFKTTEIAEKFGYNNYIGNREKGNKVL